MSEISASRAGKDGGHLDVACPNPVGKLIALASCKDDRVIDAAFATTRTQSSAAHDCVYMKDVGQMDAFIRMWGNKKVAT